MKALRTFMVIILALSLVIIAGCERKIVQEVATTDQNLAGCFGCHGETALDGAILQAHGEWKNSIHASGNNVDYTNRPGATCLQCHNHQGFIDYITTGETDSIYSNVSAIHCFTCHAPHEKGNLELRTVEAYTLKNGVVFDYGKANLCANCHHARQAMTSLIPTDADTVKLTTRFGPHYSPQADFLQGTHAYHFPGVTGAPMQHATETRDGCINCHMGNPNQHDGYDIGGHSFNMRTVDEGGTEYTLVGVCQKCHAQATSFDYNLKNVDYDGDGEVKGIQTEIHGLLDTLQALLVDAGALDATTHAPKNNKWVKKDLAGAVYNYISIEEDRSFGMHNPKYMVDLLKSSITWVKAHPAAMRQEPYTQN